MKRKNLAVALPLDQGLTSLVRSLSSLLCGAVLGLTAQALLPLPGPGLVLAGLIIGVVVGSPIRPRGFEQALARTILAVGGAFLSGYLINEGLLLHGGLAAVGTASFAAGVGDVPWYKGALRWVTGAAMLTTILYILSTIVPVHLMPWNPAALLPTLLTSGAVGLSIWLSTRLAIRPMLELPVKPVAHVTAEPRSAKKALAEPLFGAERRALDEVAGRVESLVNELVSVAPAEVEYVDQIRKTLKETLAETDESIARWRSIRKPDWALRTKELMDRIESNESRLGGHLDHSVQRALDQTLKRQRRTLEEYQRMEAAERAFALRLQQVHSGLELMELALERALTSSGAVSSDELDAIVDALNEVNAAMDFDKDLDLTLKELSRDQAQVDRSTAG